MSISREKTVKTLLASIIMTIGLTAVSAPVAYSQMAAENRGDVQKTFKELQINQEVFPKQGAPVGVLRPLPNGIPDRMQYSPQWGLTSFQRLYFAVVYLGFLLATVVWYVVGWRNFTRHHPV